VRKLAGLLLIIPLLVMAAAFLLQFIPGGQDLIDNIERKSRMASHQLFYRWRKPIPTTPRLDNLLSRLRQKELRLGAPVFLRIFKKEARLEIWMQKGDRFALFTSYPICYFSGRLGPKRKRGDRQAPEGFYTVSKKQLNPNSRWHRSFNLGYPNLFDRAHRRTGDYLMVHGGCSSVGCYAMTNKVVDEIWTLVTAALNHGQRRFQVQALPFRMNDGNMRRHSRHRWIDFWRDLQRGYELFEQSRVPPRIYLCRGRYRAEPGGAGYDGSAPLRKNCLREASL
jgi:murein L,D-transpeptidase YafK